MKKFQSLKLMLFGLLAFGGGSAFAQAPATGTEIDVDNYVYTVTKASELKNGAITTGTVQITRVAEGQKTTDGDNLVFPGYIEYQKGTTTYKYNVTTMAADVFKDNSYDAKHAVIPANLTEIPTGAFNTLTNLYDLTFAPNSQVTKIGAQAFASTQISSFDFSPCTKLEGLQDGVFVQTTTETGDGKNKNGNITTITLPTSTAFKHINGAFRNLTALTTINNLSNSWIRELVDGAFSGCENLWQINLPGNDLQYISSKALEGSAIEDLTVNVGGNATNGNPLKLLGGCTVAYVFREATQDYVYNYEGEAYTQACTDASVEPVDWDPADAETNLYGLNEENVVEVNNQRIQIIAPLRKLTIAGTLQGKVCKNAFAWCEHLANTAAGHPTTNVPTPALVVSGLYFGTKAQIETNSFYKCVGIKSLALNDINDNKLDDDEYTIEADAFKGCPIATLTLGNILTNNAIGSAAFGNSLKTVTIGTVKAATSAFEAADDDNPGAFVWANESGATLNLATGEGEFVSADNPGASIAKIIPAGTFDFSAVTGQDSRSIPISGFVFPVINIGEIKSQGGVFADGAIVGVNVDKIHFLGDINTNGLDVAILAASDATTTPTYKLSELTFAGAIKTNGIGEGAFAGFTNLAKLSFAGLLSKEAVAAGSFTNTGKVNKGFIGTKDVPFVTYTADLTDNDASENPFATGAFGTEDDDRIIYWQVSNAQLSASILAAIQQDVQGDDYEGDVVNPKFNVYKWVAYIVEEEKTLGFIVFTDNKEIALDQNTDATLAWGRYDLGSFAKEGNVANQGLEATDMIIDRYQTVKGVGGETEYNVKVTLYGMYWDQDDKGKQSDVYMVPLEVINGKYLIPVDNEHLIIAKVKNLDGEFAEDQILINYESGNYPAAATYSFDSYDAEENGTAWAVGGLVKVVSTTEDGYTIIEVTNNGTGSTDFVSQQFAVHATDIANVEGRLQLYAYEDGAVGAVIDNVWVEIEQESDGTESTLAASSVWEQLTKETAGEGPVLDADEGSIKRIFEKAANSWTNQELVDAVTNEGGAQAIANKDLHVLLDPSVNAGFDVKRLIIERKTDGTGAYIGKNWYYALLKNYGTPSTAARVIWLDYDQATAIFGVNVVKTAVEGNGAIYNLQGIRVSKATKGVYIQDGKKIIVK